MASPLRNWPLLLCHTKTRTALSLTAAILLVVAGWQGWQILRYRGNLAAAESALTRYDFAEAQHRLTFCLEARPDNRVVRLLAAQAYRRAGLLDQAEEHLNLYEQGLSGAPGPDLALQWDLLRVQRGQVKERVHDLIGELEIRHPQSEQILESLAQGCVHNYRLDEASFWTKQLLERYPHNPVGRLIDAQTNETLRRREKALEIARRLVDDFPGDFRARLYLAGLLSRSLQQEEAANEFRRLHQWQPTASAPLIGLIRTLLRLEQLEEAEPLLRKLEADHSNNTEALLLCARFAMGQKRFVDAEALLRRALQQAPHDYDTHLELAVCLEQLNRTEEARQHLERFKQIEADMHRLDKVFQAMVKAPADPGLRLEAGQICLRNGQAAEGLRWLAGALDLAPDHAATHLALADYYAGQGDEPRASYHRTRALRPMRK